MCEPQRMKLRLLAGHPGIEPGRNFSKRRYQQCVWLTLIDRAEFMLPGVERGTSRLCPEYRLPLRGSCHATGVTEGVNRYSA